MQIDVVKAGNVTFKPGGACLVLPFFEEAGEIHSATLTKQDTGSLAALLRQRIISGKAGECYYLPTPKSPYAGVLVAGLGKKKGFTPEALRRAAGSACGVFQTNHVQQVYLDLSEEKKLPAAAFIEGLILGQYRFDEFKKQETPHTKVTAATILAPAHASLGAVRKACERAVVLCTGANGARHLGNTPANELTPAALAEFAQGAAAESSMACSVLDATQIASLGMNAFLGVARGSSQPPKLIVMQYRHPKARKTVALVGKGITFDSGGISLKEANGMHEMKYDMCGAAAVLFTMMAVAELKPAVNAVAVLPVCENKTGADAQRPGDIVRAYNGVTIEVDNTDAEGRLILADALAFAVDKFKPDCVIDIATLTGGATVALGHFAAPVFGTNDALVDELIRLGEDCGERLWRLPLWADYDKLIEGTHADLCNIGPPREASSIVGACFLKRFTGKTPWAHLDIAATAFGVKHIPYLDPKHATGFGTRLLTQWVLAQAQ